MPLADYGVVIGTLNRFAREDPSSFGSFYHGKIYLDTPQGIYEGAVDVATPSGIGVEYKVIPNLSTSLFAPIQALSNGWTQLARNSSSGAIDYVRSPMLQTGPGCVFVRFDPALQWIMNLLSSLRPKWILSTGNNALTALETQISGSSRVFLFGAPYTTGRGVHDIHLNQGDPVGPFRHLDGIWQDGGTIIQRPDGSLVAFLTKFATQSLHTDNNGWPI